jgi:hypothetical protein
MIVDNEDAISLERVVARWRQREPVGNAGTSLVRTGGHFEQ